MAAKEKPALGARIKSHFINNTGLIRKPKNNGEEFVMGIYKDFCGFGKRKTSVTENKKIKRDMVKAIVKKLKAAGKPVDRQAINKEVFDKVRRRHQSKRPRNK